MFSVESNSFLISSEELENIHFAGMHLAGIKDTGIGMSEENIDAVFNEYSRFDNTKNRGIEGSCLGMSVTKKLILMMNGEIHVESEVGKGSEFPIIIKSNMMEMYNNVKNYIEFKQ